MFVACTDTQISYVSVHNLLPPLVTLIQSPLVNLYCTCPEYYILLCIEYNNTHVPVIPCSTVYNLINTD